MIYHANANINVTVKNVTRIKSGIMIKVDVIVKIQKNVIICEKRLYLENVILKMVNIQ